jgi:hypothetical protein
MTGKEQEAERLIVQGNLKEAILLCREIYEYYLFDTDSCYRAGDFGESSRAERKAEHWGKKIGELEQIVLKKGDYSRTFKYPSISVLFIGMIVICFLLFLFLK